MIVIENLDCTTPQTFVVPEGVNSLALQVRGADIDLTIGTGTDTWRIRDGEKEAFGSETGKDLNFGGEALTFTAVSGSPVVELRYIKNYNW